LEKGRIAAHMAAKALSRDCFLSGAVSVLSSPNAISVKGGIFTNADKSHNAAAAMEKVAVSAFKIVQDVIVISSHRRTITKGIAGKPLPGLPTLEDQWPQRFFKQGFFSLLPSPNGF
jgi:hypothetical protein